MSKCDIKDSSEAWNTGVKAFKKAFLISGGKTTKALQFAMNEVMENHPEFDFEPKSFTDPIIATLKKDGVVPKDYEFNVKPAPKSKKTLSDKMEERMFKQDRKEEKDKARKEDSVKNKIDKAINKFKSLPEHKRADMARKAYETFLKDGVLTEQKVKNLYAEAAGLPYMDEKFDAQIEKTAKDMQAVDDIDRRIKEIDNAIQEHKKNKTLTEERDNLYFEQLKQLEKDREKAIDEHLKSSTEFAENLNNKRFWGYNLGDFMRMNIMNPLSVLKNVTGMGIDSVYRGMAHMLASPISQYILKPLRGVNSNPLGARVRGAAGSKALKQMKRMFKYGSNEYSQEVKKVNHNNAIRQLNKALQASGAKQLKGFLATALKLHPDLIGRALGTPDAGMYEFVMASEINRIAEAKGLKGAEKQAFLMNPDAKSAEIATNLAKEATFKQALPEAIEKYASFDPDQYEKKLINKNWNPTHAKLVSAAIHISRVITTPFIKTPYNLIRLSTDLVVPEIALSNAIGKATRETDPIEKQRILLDASAKAAIAFHFRIVALKMVAMGLISAGYSDEDEKTKDIVETKAGGPNKFNYNAFIRGLMFMDMTEKPTDRYIDLNAVGLSGIGLGAYAHAYNQFSKEDIEKQTQYTQDWTNALAVPINSAFSQFTAALDYTFFSGFNQLERAARNKLGYERKQYAANSIATLFTGVVPSTAQKLSTQISPEIKRPFDKDKEFWGLHGNLANTFKYRFLFDDKELKNKYFSLAEEGGAVKKKDYMLFDNYFGRVLQSELGVFKSTKATGDTPVSRLYYASRESAVGDRSKLFPNSIDDQISVKYRRNNKSETRQVQLTEEQFAYIQEQASNYRMMLATPYIMSDDFNTDDFGTKAATLQNFYQQGLDYAKKNLKSEYPEIGTQITDKPQVDNKTVKKRVKDYKTILN
jgi:hypothetical protein